METFWEHNWEQHWTSGLSIYQQSFVQNLLSHGQLLYSAIDYVVRVLQNIQSGQYQGTSSECKVKSRTQNKRKESLKIKLKIKWNRKSKNHTHFSLISFPSMASKTDQKLDQYHTINYTVAVCMFLALSTWLESASFQGFLKCTGF